jgi:hypothetical protein
MAMEPREQGGPIHKYWEEPATISQLEQVKGWLMKNAKKVNTIKYTRPPCRA